MTLILSNIKVCKLLLFFPQAWLASNYGYMITISNDEEKIYTQIKDKKNGHLKICYLHVLGGWTLRGQWIMNWVFGREGRVEVKPLKRDLREV